MKKQLVTLIIIFTVHCAYSQVYEWRGEGRKGIYDGAGLLTEWPENGPEMLWSLENLPNGYSSPSIAYQTIYLTGVHDTTDVLTALDLGGNIKWQTVYGRAWLRNYPASRCTPTIEDHKLYVTSGIGEIACINADNGNIIWKLDAHAIYEGEFGRFGLSESPLIVDEKLFYTTGGNRTTMIALNKTNGELIWESKSMNEPPAFVSPLLIEENGKRIIATLTKNHAIGVNPDNGDILWEFDYRPYAEGRAYDNHANTPLYEDGSIFITSGYNRKSVKLKLANDLSSVTVEWTNDVLDSQHGSIVKLGNYIYGSSYDNNTSGKWICVDWKTGETMYEQMWMSKGPIIAAGGYLYIYDEKYGNVGLVIASPKEFKVISSFKVTLGKKGPFWPHPVIDNGILYLRHEDAFMAYSIAEQ
jgi:outer membrane protein assembly factor BamB